MLTPEGDHHAMQPDMHQLLSFRVGEMECAVNLSFVHEVIRYTEMVRFPGLAGTVAGAIHRDETFLPVVDLRQQFETTKRIPDDRSRILILRATGQALGLLVDALGEIVSTSSRAIQAPPAWMSALNLPYIQGLGNAEGRWFLVLDPSGLLQGDTKAVDLAPWPSAALSSEDNHRQPGPEASPARRPWRHKVPRQPLEAQEPAVELQSTLDAQSLKELEEMAKAMSEGDFHRQVSSTVHGELENLATYIGKTMANLQLLDPSVRLSAERDIPTASQQLSDVVKSTEEATNTIISLTDTLMDHQATLGESIEKLKLQKPRSPEYQDLIRQIEQLHMEDEKTLMEIITSLSFQDLTGQRINKIVTMVATVQDKLRDLIQAFGIKVDEVRKDPVPEPSPEPAAEEAGKLAQDSVDSLLNQLFN
jgi:chemotaxis signal transduction protein/chemotaxis regulatin CheY-phosphate phosphatase CheZ